MSDFHRELGRNLVGLFSHDNLTPFLIGGLVTGAAVIPEQDVEDYFLGTTQFESVTTPGDLMGQAFVLAPVFADVLTLSRQTENVRFRNVAYSLMQGYVVNNVIVRPAKSLVRRERPSMENDRSFPSLHTTNSFMWATVLSHHYGKKVGIPAYLAATY